MNAYILTVAQSAIVVRSLRYIRNKSGQAIEPWGTPHLRMAFSEKIPFVYTV